MPIEIRHMQKVDLSTAVEIERQANLQDFEVPGVGTCSALAPWAWTEQDFLTAIRQYKHTARGMHDTRAFVAISTEDMLDELSGEKVQVELVVGSMVYEIHEDGFEILRLSAVATDDETRVTFIQRLRQTCEASAKRHLIRCYISDGDWQTLRFFVRLGWERRLVPSFYQDGRDCWVVETRVAAPPPTTKQST